MAKIINVLGAKFTIGHATNSIYAKGNQSPFRQELLLYPNLKRYESFSLSELVNISCCMCRMQSHITGSCVLILPTPCMHFLSYPLPSLTSLGVLQ